ncbi:hypothetical protein GJAV_G00058660 [Gymnothorax javanicus]|nr:hypothetical protein GJAV_G00058660 [Gymnothorax javanicus]
MGSNCIFKGVIHDVIFQDLPCDDIDRGSYTVVFPTGHCIYSTVGPVSVTPGGSFPETSAHREKNVGSSSYRLAAVCLGLLCVLFLTTTIVLSVLYLRLPKCESEEYFEVEKELEMPRANFSQGTEVEMRKANKTSLAMLEEKFSYLDQYCPYSIPSKKRKCKPCPEDWEQFGSKCYYFSTEKKSWTDSRNACIKQGADLVVIEREEEQDFITKHVREDSWIGLSDSENEGAWLWVDKTSLRIQLWIKGEPDNHYQPGNKTGANCAITVTQSQTWEDTHCYSLHKTVCETDALSS